MSGPQARPFKGRLGFDANNDKVVNLADPTELYDGMNLRTFIEKNTIPPFDPTRPYPAGFIVERDNRLFKSKFAIGNGPFNATQWSDIHAYGRWLRITGAYTAEAGDNLLVSTQNGSFKVNLPSPADDGDIVTIIDEGYARTYPITVSTSTNTIDNKVGDYSINSPDICKFVFLAGTWKVIREEKRINTVAENEALLAPNSFNLVRSETANKNMYLPKSPIDGQWVTVADANNDAGNYYTRIDGNSNQIDGKPFYVMNRFGSQVTFVYNAATLQWRAASNQGERKFANTLFPLLTSQTAYVPLTSATQTLTLPQSEYGDWVEIVATAQDGVTGGSIVIRASEGGYFRTAGGTRNSITYRISRRGRTLFVLHSSNEWSVIQLENEFLAPTISSGIMTKNTMQVLTGSASSVVYLPSIDSVQVGDIITTQMVTDTGRVVVSVQNTDNEIVDGLPSLTYQASDYGILVSYVYVGWNGTKYSWKVIDHGTSYIKKSMNLADIPDKSIARFNLGVYGQTESDQRYLALHGTADSAKQAENSNKLGGLYGYDYIKVQNPNITAVDANITTETRFSTNINTPDATMWQVVMFIDTTSGTKAQIAMNMESNQIAYRTFGSSGWTGWGRLDQNANSASATKLQSARTINDVAFDGTSNITVKANPKVTPIAENSDLNSFVVAGCYACTLSATTLTLINSPSNVAFSMVVAESTNGGVTQTLREYGGNGYNMCWYRSLYISNWTQWFRIYDEANPQPNVSGNAGTASKWATPRTLTLTGGVTGSATFDGSGNITISTTAGPASGSIEISNVNGLQTALDSKLATTAKAADSAKLAGVAGESYKLNVIPSNNGEDPNTVIKTSILTNHANTPDAGASYWYIDTEYYVSLATTSNRYQVAKQYNNGSAFYVRNCYNNTWSAWTQLSTITAGSTLPVNISGSADYASRAGKLSTAVQINGVSFDGSVSITAPDATKLPLAGGRMTGRITRAGGSGVTSWVTIDEPVTKSMDSQVNGTMAIKLPVGMNETMMKFTVSVFNYNTNSSFSLEISGYNYSTGWVNCTVQSSGVNSDLIGATVRFAKDATNAYILIGSTTSVWQYPKVTIRDVELGYTGAQDPVWNNAWDVVYSTTETGFSGIVATQIDPWVAKLNRKNTFTQEQTIAANGPYLRSVYGNYGTMLYQDSSTWYFMKTASGDQYGTYDAIRALSITLATGDVGMSQSLSVGNTLNVTGNANVTGILKTTAQAALNAGSISGGWYRSIGQVGWYSETYGGGIFMTDTTWVRTYGSKGFYVANDIAATGTITANYSDKRLKENLNKIPNALDTVKSWTGYTYNANAKAKEFGYDTDKKEIGLIAQEVQKTTPEAIEQAPFDRTGVAGESLTGEHYLTLKYDRLVPVLVEAIKEQDAQIQELKQQVASLLDAFKSTK